MSNLLKKIGTHVVCDLEDVICMADDNESLSRLISKCMSSTSAGSTIIGIIVWEVTPPRQWLDRINKFYDGLVDRKFVLILNSVYEFYHVNFSFSAVYIDFFMLRVYFETNVNNEGHPVNKEWNPTATKFLFLIGKIASPNRIRLLYKLQQANLLDVCVWSLFVNEEGVVYDKARKLLPELSDSKFSEFVSKHARNPDDVDIMGTESEQGSHYGAFPYDVSLFRDTLFRVIPETTLVDIMKPHPPWFTEKTWMTVSNHQPFIMAGGTPGILERMKSKGFKTFSEYLKHPQYDTVDDVEVKLDLVVSNVEHLLRNMNEETTKRINADVKHNYRLYEQLTMQNIGIIEGILTDIGHPEYNPFDVLSFDPDAHLTEGWNETLGVWDIFYNNIKDDSWPECNDEKDFIKLPELIRRECIEEFGYSPRY
jgi:hypothetical protein